MPIIGDQAAQGVATVAKQNIMITALQLIDDLRDALNSVDSDKLNVHIKSTDISAGDATAANQTTMITALQLIDDLRNALNSVGSDKLDVNLKTTDVTIGDATAANQTTMITALQLIDDLRGALGSVDTDDLQVDVKTVPTTTVQSLNGDKIWSYSDMIEEEIYDPNLFAGNNNVSGTPVPAGEIWVVTHVTLEYSGTTPVSISARIKRGSFSCYLTTMTTIAVGIYYGIDIGKVYLKEGDYMEMRIIGATLNDDARFRYVGYKMQI